MRSRKSWLPASSVLSRGSQVVYLPTAERVLWTVPAARAVIPMSSMETWEVTDTVLTRVAALKTLPIPQLKQQWRDLFESEPPPYNRRFLEHRLAYRIQELAYGGLKPATLKRLRELAEDLDGGNPLNRRRHHQDRPMAGTRLIREWQGVEHCVTVRQNDIEYQGRPFTSLSAVARAITGTQWNGWTFFGLKNRGRG